MSPTYPTNNQQWILVFYCHAIVYEDDKVYRWDNSRMHAQGFPGAIYVATINVIGPDNKHTIGLVCQNILYGHLMSYLNFIINHRISLKEAWAIYIVSVSKFLQFWWYSCMK